MLKLTVILAGYGNVSIFLSLSGAAPPPAPPPAPGPAPGPASPWSCELFSCDCQLMVDYCEPPPAADSGNTLALTHWCNCVTRINGPRLSWLTSLRLKHAQTE